MSERFPTSSRSRGYRRLADYMAWDRPTAIFRRFLAANAFNLLGLQAEICRLQEDLLRQVETDEKHDPAQSQYQINWSALLDGDNGSSEQRRVVMELRRTLGEYSQSVFCVAGPWSQVLRVLVLWQISVRCCAC